MEIKKVCDFIMLQKIEFDNGMNCSGKANSNSFVTGKYVHYSPAQQSRSASNYDHVKIRTYFVNNSISIFYGNFIINT
jgi:tRNA U34 2-thiouridine synthase MnmA/TrmU